MIYLDNSATSFPKPKELLVDLNHYLTNQVLTTNRSGEGLEGLIEETRNLLLQLIGGQSKDKLIFTLNSTDSINIALRNFLKKGDHVVTSSFEHSAVSKTLLDLEKNEIISLTVVEPDKNGKITLQNIKDKLNSKTKMVVMVHGSNITGDIIPDEKIGKFLNNKGIIYFLDASQSVGSTRIDVKKSNIDILAFSCHKSLLGPSGVGALYLNKNLKLRIFRTGGIGRNVENSHKEISSEYETGTQNILGIIGLNSSLKYLNKIGLHNVYSKKKELMKYCVNELLKIENIEVYGNFKSDIRLPIVSFNIKDLSPQRAVGPLLRNGYNIVTRAGLHCCKWGHETLGTFPEGSIRVSIGIFNTREDINNLIRAIKEINEFHHKKEEGC